jgi:dienelactone hydrolase
VSVLKGEGTTVILYGSTSVPTVSRQFGGYLARPDLTGEWPTVLVVAPSNGAGSAVRAICRLIARHAIAAVAPESGGLDAFVAFITNPAGHWSNAEYGYGVLGIGDGATEAITHASSAHLVSAVALVGPELEATALDALEQLRVPLLGCAAAADDDGLDRARAAAPQGEWVIYKGADPRYWDIDADGFAPTAASDTSDRVLEFFADALPEKI